MAAGGIFGLAAARLLFELDPLKFYVFGAWPGALLLAGVGLAAAVALSVATRRLDAETVPSSSWAPIVLALPLIGLLSPEVNLLRSVTLLAGAPALLVLLLIAPAIPAPDEGAPASPLHRRPFDLVLSLSLFLFLFILYLRTLAPAVGQADTFEFQVGVARLGIAHGSGYPLLMLIGRVFTLLPVGGTLAFRANLTSAFFGALAGVGVARLTRLLGASTLVASLAGLAFGVSPTLWSRAVEIEAYTLNAAFVVTILYLAIRLLRASDDTNHAINPQLPITHYQLRLCLLAFLFGLSLTNHLTTLLLIPAVVAAVLMGIIARQASQTARHGISLASVTRPLLSKGVRPLPPSFQGGSSPAPFLSWGLVLLLFLLGLSLYLYLPLRWPAINHGEALSWAGFVNIITGNEAKGAFQWRLPFQDAGRYPIVWSKIAGEYGWVGLGLAVLGALSLLGLGRTGARPNPPSPAPNQAFAPLAHIQGVIAHHGVLAVLALAYAGYLYFALAFNVPDPDFSAFFIPLHLIAAVLMGLGVQALLNFLGSQRLAHSTLPANALLTDPHTHTPTHSSRSTPLGHTLPNSHTPILSVLVVSAFALLPLTSIWRSFPLVDRSGNWVNQKAGELMLSQPLAAHAAILADSEKIAPLDYLQIAEGWRPDLDIIVLPDEASYRAALDERLAAGQVVYLGRYLPGLGSAYSLRSVGPLAEVSPTPFTSSPLAVQPALAQPKAAGIKLAGYAQMGGLPTLSAAAPGELNITLVWRAPATPAENLSGQPTAGRCGRTNRVAKRGQRARDWPLPHQRLAGRRGDFRLLQFADCAQPGARRLPTPGGAVDAVCRSARLSLGSGCPGHHSAAGAEPNSAAFAP